MELVAALDQGTTSTRCIIFDAAGRPRGSGQLEHRQLLARPGWVGHDPAEIWERAGQVVAEALREASATGAELAGIGIANQRETVVVWDRRSGRPLADAIVWQDTRTAAEVSDLVERGHGPLLVQRTGLPPSTYFSATKLAWLLEHTEGLREAAIRGDALFGTVDSWLIWQLTDGAEHVIDVTNASRTQLMDLERRCWDEELLDLFNVPVKMLPRIVPSIGPIATTSTDGPFGARVPIAAALGDQQAAMVGQACFSVGEVKCTYGTGSFVLLNTGERCVRSAHGLLSTVCYERAGQPARYALEGSVAVTGAAVQWLRDQLGIISEARDIETLAATVPDSAGLVFVPAFSGLYAPRWRSDARGVIVGLTRAHTRGHLARATLEAIAQQCREVIEAMCEEIGTGLEELKVDGGVAADDLAMQLQADVLGVEVVRPAMIETTALGAASAAGLGLGLYQSEDTLRAAWREGARFHPTWAEDTRASARRRWDAAVSRALDWEA